MTSASFSKMQETEFRMNLQRLGTKLKEAELTNNLKRAKKDKRSLTTLNTSLRKDLIDHRPPGVMVAAIITSIQVINLKKLRDQIWAENNLRLWMLNKKWEDEEVARPGKTRIRNFTMTKACLLILKKLRPKTIRKRLKVFQPGNKIINIGLKLHLNPIRRSKIWYGSPKMTSHIHMCQHQRKKIKPSLEPTNQTCPNRKTKIKRPTPQR